MQPKDRETSTGLIAHWRAIPLYARIIVAVALGVGAGLALGDSAHILETPAKLVLRLLGALAPPLILLAIVQALMRAHLGGGQALRLVALLFTNTLVAILIGLAVANVLQPGAWTAAAPAAPAEKAAAVGADPLTQFLDSVPKSLLGPFGDNGAVMGVIFIAVAFGVALRGLRTHEVRTVEDLVHVALTSLIAILHWIIDVVPLAVFGLIASIVGVKGFRDFFALGGFFIAVVTALALQFLYYLLRIRLGSWARPLHVVAGMRDALLMAFSTGSSTATMPLTYELLRERVGLREQSASMGALVGSNFNNDGTALYEAMAALFVAQLLGLHLTLGQQFLVVLTSIVASVGAAGIPEAGLVTMTMVFRAVALPTDYIALLLTVDWLLDRCRTAINVMGDVTVSCLLDGKTRASEAGEGEGASPPPLR